MITNDITCHLEKYTLLFKKVSVINCIYLMSSLVIVPKLLNKELSDSLLKGTQMEVTWEWYRGTCVKKRNSWIFENLMYTCYYICETNG